MKVLKGNERIISVNRWDTWWESSPFPSAYRLVLINCLSLLSYDSGRPRRLQLSSKQEARGFGGKKAVQNWTKKKFFFYSLAKLEQVTCKCWKWRKNSKSDWWVRVDAKWPTGGFPQDTHHVVCILTSSGKSQTPHIWYLNWAHCIKGNRNNALIGPQTLTRNVPLVMDQRQKRNHLWENWTHIPCCMQDFMYIGLPLMVYNLCFSTCFLTSGFCLAQKLLPKWFEGASSMA